MKHDEETPFPREPWRRLLQHDAGEPPETTDARIRKAARRELAPRISRWLLPASLAASFVLAVVIVERQYGGRESPEVVTEADFVPQRAPARSREDPRVRKAPATAAAPPARVDERAAPPGVVSQEFVPEPADAASGDRDAIERSPVGGPERDLEAASEMPAKESRAESPPDAPAAMTAPLPEPEPETEATQTPADVASDRQSALKLPDPDEWYARIEKLRAEGKNDDADRELKRLKAAYPGWLERRLEEQKKRQGP